MTPQHTTQIDQFLFVKTDKGTSYHHATMVPKIIGEQNLYLAQRRAIIKRYQQYAQSHNDSLSLINKEVVSYNANIIAFTEQNELTQRATQENELLLSEFAKCSIYAYNAAVEIKNQQSDTPLLLKRKLPRLRKHHEQSFMLILWTYSHQMDAKNKLYKNINATTTRAIQRLKINHHQIANMLIDDVRVLTYCKRTVQNHVHRLIECGVFIDYRYKGHKKPIEVFINDELMVLYDSQNKKQISTENQLFTPLIEKNLHNNNIVTRTYINKLQIIEPVNKQSQIKGILIHSPKGENQSNKNESTQTSNQKNQLDRGQAAAQNLQKISEFLLDKTEDTTELLKDVSNGRYSNYRFTDRRLLEKEVLSGDLTRHEFRELLIQYFIKTTAPLYKDKDVFYPSWRKAFNLINTNEFLNPNNSVPNKTNLLYKFDNLLYRITYAKRFFNKYSDFNPLFPSQYFCPYRKTKKSGGFAYTIEALKRQQDIEAYTEKKKQREINVAAKNNARYRAIELVEKKINEVKHKKCTVAQLHDYVTNNAHIPQSVAIKLPDYIQRAFQSN